MLQTVKCNDQSCCKFRTNYLTYFPERFLPPPVPLKSSIDRLEISETKFRSLFQAIILAKYSDKCFDKIRPSLQKVNKKGKRTMQNRTCWKCGKYNSTIKAINFNKRTCDRYKDENDDKEPEEDEDKDEENEEDYIEAGGVYWRRRSL